MQSNCALRVNNTFIFPTEYWLSSLKALSIQQKFQIEISENSICETGYRRALQGTTILSDRKGHFCPTDLDDRIGQSGPPLRCPR